MKPINLGLMLGAGALLLVTSTGLAAQGAPPAAAPAGGRAQATPGQIAIAQPCTPEQIAQAQQTSVVAPAAGRGRGGRGTPCHMPDPREGLTPGLYDAGMANKNMVLVTTLHQPAGMFDPANETAGGRNLDYANSDLAFGMDGKLAVQGNFHGLIFYDISDPSHTKLETILACPGGQGDVSVWGNLAFMSVESDGRIDCSNLPPPAPRGGAAPAGAAPAAARGRGGQTPDPNRARGVRIFDISNPLKPKNVAAVQTCRGSHTHTIVLDPKDKANIYIYVSGTAGVRSAEEKSGCDAGGPEDPHTSSYGIDVIKVPLAHPEQSAVVNHAYIFEDANTGQIASLYGRQQGTGEPSATPTQGCHDVTSYPWAGLTGGACAGNGLLLDTSDPVHPKRLDDVADAAFSFWHSATFNNDATKVLFSDEWGGGTQAMCQQFDPPMWGGDAVFDIQGAGAGRHLHFGGYYKMSAWQTANENCVAHNGSLIPVPGRDIMSQAFYQGGATVFDFTDPAKVKEIAFFDRGPISPDHLVIGGYWAVYYYNGYLYGSEIARGFDVFQLTPSEYLSQNEIDAAKLATREGCGASNDFNAQCQPHYVVAASFTVARAYLDQLVRDKALPQDRANAIDAAMKQVEGGSGSARNAAKTTLNGLAAELTKDAATAPAMQAKRMRECAATIEKHNAELK